MRETPNGELEAIAAYETSSLKFAPVPSTATGSKLDKYVVQMNGLRRFSNLGPASGCVTLTIQ